MKIIFSQPVDEIAEHAKKVVAEAQAKSRSPIGVPAHTARVASVCEDCGETYWHRNDEYGWFAHIGCAKDKKSMGF